MKKKTKNNNKKKMFKLRKYILWKNLEYSLHH